MLIVYHSGDYHRDRLVNSITVVLHVVPIHIYITKTCLFSHHVRVLEKYFWDTNTAFMISFYRDDGKSGGIRWSGILRGYTDRKVLSL
jgi:hypothetical protein